MIIGTERVVKLPGQRSGAEQGLSSLEEVIHVSVVACQRVPPWIVQEQIFCIDLPQRFYVVCVDRIDLTSGERLVRMQPFLLRARGRETSRRASRYIEPRVKDASSSYEADLPTEEPFLESPARYSSAPSRTRAN